MRAAEIIGDMTQPVMARFYARCPQAKVSFEHHSSGKRERLEAEMIDNVLYCIMTWFERPEEIRILLYGSIPHHHETLHVDADWYEALLGAGIDLIIDTVPPEQVAERALWEEMRQGITEAVTAARRSILPSRNQRAISA